MTIHLTTSLPGPVAQRLITEKFEKYMGLVAYPYPFIYGGDGRKCCVQDIDGNTFLDFVSQIAAQPLGYNHPKMCAVSQKYAGKAPLKLAGHDFYPVEHGDMIEAIANTAPALLDSVFLINSGAEAVENAIKICYRHKPMAKTGISFYGAFHGRTLGALSLTCSKAKHKKHYPEIPVRRLPYPTQENYEEVLASFENILHYECDPSTVAYVIMELVQGEGGYRIAPRKFVHALRVLTKKEGIPLIVDEIQSGVGRTGTFWAFEQYGITPDLFTAAKALQVGATVTSKELFPKEGGAISSTWGGGNIMDMAMGVAIVTAIREEHLLDHVKKMGTYLLRRVTELSEKYPLITHPRGLGLMVGFDLPTAELAEKLMQKSYQQGLLTLTCGKNSMRLIPPLIVTTEEIDEGMDVLERSVRNLQ